MKAKLLVLILYLLPVCAFSQIGGYTASLDGIDDYISVQNSTSLNYSAFTVEAWVLYQDTDGGKVFGKSESGGAVPGFNMGVEGNLTLTCECFQSWGTSVTANSTKTLISGVWNHIAMTWSSGGYLCGYINGEQVINKASGSLSISSSNTITIGKAPWTSINQGHFKGKIDEVRYWNVVRSQAEIKTNMFKEIDANSNLKVYYKMSDGSGTTITDNSGNNYTGTMYNNPAWKASGCFTGPKQTLNFDGTDDYVGLPVSFANAFNSLQHFSFSGWVYHTNINTTNWGTYFSVSNTTSNYGRVVFHQLPSSHPAGYDDVLISISQNTSNLYGEAYTTGNVIELNKWMHISFVFDGTASGNSNRLKLYINGKETALTFSSDIPSAFTNSYDVYSMGKHITQNYFKGGNFDEFSFWNISLNEGQVKEYMMRSLIGNETGLFAYYRFDHKDGTTLYDATANGLNGTLTNMDPTTDWVTSSAFNTWIGSESSSWSTAENWSSGAAPVSSDNVGLYKWTQGNECILNGIPTVNILNFSSSSAPTLSSNITITGNLNLSKNVDMNGQTLTLGSSTGSPGKSVTGSYFLTGTGTVKRWFGTTAITSETGLYPVGVNTNNRNLTLSGTPTTGGTISVAYTDASGVTTFGSSFVENGKTFIQRSNSGWTVTVADGFVCSNLSMAIRGDGIPGISNISDLNMSGASGSALGTYSSPTGTTSSPVVNRTGLNTSLFNPLATTSYYFASTSNSPLPVTLSSFTASVNKRDAILNWTTSSEINNAGFEVERVNRDEFKVKTYERVGYISGKGSTSTSTNYTFEDANLNTGKYQYRLKQIDNNGNFAYHNLNGYVEVGVPAKYDLSQNYPNPFNPTTKIDFHLPHDSKVSIVIYDITGKEVKTLMNNEFRKADYYTVMFNGSNLSSGVYFYKLIANKYLMTKKMVLLK